MPQESRIFVSTSRLIVGRFRCEPSSDLWRQENCTGEYPLLVFPRTAVEIHQADRPSVVATPVQAILYNARHAYRRDLIDPRGDACEFLSVSPALIDEIFQAHGRPLPNAAEPFPLAYSPCSATIYLQQRRLIDQLYHSPWTVADSNKSTLPSDRASELEEQLLLTVSAAIDEAMRFHQPFSKSKIFSWTSQHWDLVEAAKDYVARHAGEKLTIGRIAESIDCSVFHLCRIFKQLTGRTVHSFILQYRLRSAAERVMDTGDSLTDIALDFGFASHSHFTNAFRKLFGCSPKQMRRGTF